MRRPRLKSDISARLKDLRLRKRLSAKDVADELGVAESTYRDWEYGRAIHGEPYLVLAKIFGVSLSELLSADIVKERAFILDRLRKIEDMIVDIRTTL